jgi:hypothetical protein
MSYQKIQFIAYRIYTGPGRKPARYVGLNDQAADIAIRINLMQEAIQAAAGSDQIDPDPGTLKIFMAPEFYFRGVWGAYTTMDYFSGGNDVPFDRSILGGLAGLVGDPKWKDWLFVFGTAVVKAADYDIVLDPRDSALQNKTAVLNLAVAQRGGYASEAERVTKCVAVVKEHMSDIDWLHVQGPVLPPEQAAYYPAVGPGNYRLELNTAGRGGGGGFSGGSIFGMDDLIFGLEVCLDHDTGRLRQARPRRYDPFVQIQLIPSGGTVIQPDKVAATHGGLVFNVDGTISGVVGTDPADDEDGYHSQVFTVTTRGWPDTAEGLQETLRAVRFPANTNLDVVGRVFWLPPKPDPATGDPWTPEIAIYPALAAPPLAIAGQ